MNNQVTEKSSNTFNKIEVVNYPYGGLKTKAYFSIEFNEKKGFRSIFQTIDPKTDRLNNPKKSTYSFFQYLQVVDRDGNNFVNTKGLGLPHDVKTLKDFVRSLNPLDLVLTEEMIKYIGKSIYLYMNLTIVYTDPKDKEKINVDFAPYLAILKNMQVTGINRMPEIEQLMQVNTESDSLV